MPALRPVCPSPAQPSSESFKKFFPNSSAGYWLQWSNEEASIWRCVGIKAEQIATLEATKLSKANFFNEDNSRKSGWLNRFKKLFSSKAADKEQVKIVQVFAAEEGFLLVLQLDSVGSTFGFVNADFESFSISSTASFDDKNFKIVSNEPFLALNPCSCQEQQSGGNWKRNRRLEIWIDLSKVENCFVRSGFLCYGKSAIRLEDGTKFTLPANISEKAHLIEKDDFLYLLQSDVIFEICLESGSVRQQSLPTNCCFFSDEFLIQFDVESKRLGLLRFSLFPREVEFLSSNQLVDQISCPFEICDVVFGVAEVFLLDRLGAVWSCVLPNAEPLTVSYCPVEELEFAHIFNILGPFPIASTQFYWQRRREIADGQLCFDEAIKEALGAGNVLFGPERFPPANWPNLSQFCRDLFKGCRRITDAAGLVFYLLLCADLNDTTRQEIFCAEFGISTMQVLKMRLFWLIDHSKAEEACTLLLKNVAQMKLNAGILVKLIETALRNGVDFSELASFAPGNLVSLDDFLTYPSLLQSLFSEALRKNSVLQAIDGIKCMFARMKPSDLAAQIPVPQLHLQVLNCLLAALLQVRCEQVFLSRAMELAELPFETEIVSSFKKALQEEEGCDENDPIQRKRILLKLFELKQPDNDSTSSISLLSQINTTISNHLTVPATDPLARFFQKNSPTSTPSKSSRTSASPVASPARPLQLRPNSPLQLPRHFPPKQPTRLSQPLDEDAPVVLAESKRLSKRKANEGSFVVDDEEVGEIAVFATKEHAPLPSNKRRRK